MTLNFRRTFTGFSENHVVTDTISKKLNNVSYSYPVDSPTAEKLAGFKRNSRQVLEQELAGVTRKMPLS